MLQNARVTVFTVSELLRENELGEGGKIITPHTPRLGLKCPFEIIFCFRYEVGGFPWPYLSVKEVFRQFQLSLVFA